MKIELTLWRSLAHDVITNLFNSMVKEGTAAQYKSVTRCTANAELMSVTLIAREVGGGNLKLLTK